MASQGGNVVSCCFPCCKQHGRCRHFPPVGGSSKLAKLTLNLPFFDCWKMSNFAVSIGSPGWFDFSNVRAIGDGRFFVGSMFFAPPKLDLILTFFVDVIEKRPDYAGRFGCVSVVMNMDAALCVTNRIRKSKTIGKNDCGQW